LKLESKLVTVQNGEGIIQAYYVKAKKTAPNTPAILIIHDLFGLDEHVEAVCNLYARAGYAVLAPDLYSRDRKGALSYERLEQLKIFYDTIAEKYWSKGDELNHLIDQQENPEEIRETIVKLGSAAILGPNARNTDQMMSDMNKCVEWLYAQRFSSVGGIGYCLGGTLIFELAAICSGLKAAVVYYGRDPGKEKMKNIECPVLGLYAINDTKITEKVPATVETMAELGKTFTYQIYDHAGHAFFNDTRKSYDPKTSRRALAETLYFLSQNLS
jgi:carboxymethylenebutenolidase